MKAIVKTSTEAMAYAVKDVPAPKPGAGQVLIRVKATGLCYTDMSILKGEYKGRKPVPIPVIMGHEASGVVAEVGRRRHHGEGRPAHRLRGPERLREVRRTAAAATRTCARTGTTSASPATATFAEYVVQNEALVYPLPDNVDFADAALLEPLSLTVRSLEHVKPLPGSRR